MKLIAIIFLSLSIISTLIVLAAVRINKDL